MRDNVVSLTVSSAELWKIHTLFTLHAMQFEVLEYVVVLDGSLSRCPIHPLCYSGVEIMTFGRPWHTVVEVLSSYSGCVDVEV